MRKTRVLLVGMLDSVHVARWVAQFSPSEFEFLLFPSTPNRRFHHIFQTTQVVFLHHRLVTGFIWLFDFIFRTKFMATLLANDIKRLNPDFVHALEFQHAAYLSENALAREGLTNLFIATNFGSDIFWFRNFPSHLERIRSVLARVNRYSAECERDIALARDLGFLGTALPVIPNSGPVDQQYLNRQVRPPNERKLILVKGYQGWVGRANLAAKALAQLKHELDGHEIVFYSCNLRTRVYLVWLRLTADFKVKAYSKNSLSHDAMMDLFSEALLYIGVSLSDGISTSMLEALCMGAYPVQTYTACTSEWFVPGIQGAVLDIINVDEIKLRISESLKVAAGRNPSEVEFSREALRTRLNTEVITNVAKKFYELRDSDNFDR